jgi:small redox-active disulfide protein 2
MTESEIAQIKVGKDRVGIIGLKQVLTEVAQDCSGKPDSEIEAELYRRLSKRNYIPEPVKIEYRRAFLREFKKSTGQPVEKTDSNGLEIKVLGPGCLRCNQLEQDVMAVLNEMDMVADIEHIRDINAISEYGVMGTPALVINGKVVAVGTVPPRAKLKKWLQ